MLRGAPVRSRGGGAWSAPPTRDQPVAGPRPASPLRPTVAGLPRNEPAHAAREPTTDGAGEALASRSAARRAESAAVLGRRAGRPPEFDAAIPGNNRPAGWRRRRRAPRRSAAARLWAGWAHGGSKRARATRAGGGALRSGDTTRAAQGGGGLCTHRPRPRAAGAGPGGMN